MPPPSPRRTPALLAAVLDLVAVVVFAAAGRSSHAEDGGVLEVLAIAWPFAVGAALGWTAHVGVRRAAPVAPVAGLWVLAGAVVGGHALRVLSGRGTAVSFVLVSVAVLGVLLLGWRVVARPVTRLLVRPTPR